MKTIRNWLSLIRQVFTTVYIVTALRSFASGLVERAIGKQVTNLRVAAERVDMNSELLGARLENAERMAQWLEDRAFNGYAKGLDQINRSKETASLKLKELEAL